MTGGISMNIWLPPVREQAFGLIQHGCTYFLNKLEVQGGENATNPVLFIQEQGYRTSGPRGFPNWPEKLCSPCVGSPALTSDH